MKLPYSEPDPAGSERARNAKKIRDLATEVARLQPQALTRSNAEESDHSDKFPANFTHHLSASCTLTANIALSGKKAPMSAMSIFDKWLAMMTTRSPAA